MRIFENRLQHQDSKNNTTYGKKGLYKKDRATQRHPDEPPWTHLGEHGETNFSEQFLQLLEGVGE